ncbi:hypothetical protein TSOC111612_08940 [Tsukamurella ocularis]
MIEIGTDVVVTVAGKAIRCRVAAIRRAPFSYVELEPMGGGRRRSMPLRVVEAAVRGPARRP